ncbi:MAG TPA: hypothetical protein VFL98_02070 [Candidatus Paceibacterota bacterium]|nr:hypothetical protein [Candidatus Paceibacterota bacterium]
MRAIRIKYGKLVRDGVVERMREQGLEPRWRLLEGGEMRLAILRKIAEEAAEAVAAFEYGIDRAAFLSELADIKIALDAALAAHGTTYRELRLVERRKRAEKRVRGFTKRVFLLSARAKRSE